LHGGGNSGLEPVMKRKEKREKRRVKRELYGDGRGSTF
jgi:hypothetical protein